MTETNIEYIYETDILEYNEAQVIAHQCNCTSKNAAGLAKQLFEKYPYANVYNGRKKPSTPGTNKMLGNKKNGERYICAMFSQFRPGKPGKLGGKDDINQRKEWFRECLNNLAGRKGIKSIAFPYGIGCGLAGGDWEEYESMIEEWAEENSNLKIKIISKEPEPEEECSSSEGGESSESESESEVKKETKSSPEEKSKGEQSSEDESEKDESKPEVEGEQSSENDSEGGESEKEEPKPEVEEEQSSEEEPKPEVEEEQSSENDSGGEEQSSEEEPKPEVEEEQSSEEEPEEESEKEEPKPEVEEESEEESKPEVEEESEDKGEVEEEQSSEEESEVKGEVEVSPEEKDSEEESDGEFNLEEESIPEVKKEDTPSSQEKIDLRKILPEAKFWAKKIEKLSTKQKLLLLDHLVKKVPECHEYYIPFLENLSEEENISDFYEWVWNQMKSLNIPFLSLDYFVEKYEKEKNKTSPSVSNCNHISSDESIKKRIDIIPFEEDEKSEDDSEENIVIEESDDEYSLSEEEEIPTKTKKILSWSNISLLDYTKLNVPKGWEDFFDDIIENEGLNEVSEFLEKEAGKYTIFPPIHEVYKAFNECPFSNLKVVIIGQDPYPSEGAAMGVAFGHHDERTKLQPSLRNIYKCLEKDGYRADFSSGDLGLWCCQGVFLINTSLTVRKGEAGSHIPGKWDYFIGQLFRYLDENCDHLVIMLWGSKAQKYSSFFSQKKHLHIRAPHPAASAYNPKNTEFFDHQPFSKANKFLKKHGIEEIEWDLVCDSSEDEE